MLNRVLLKVKRFRQGDAECALASVASLVNFFDTDITLKNIRKLIKSIVPQYTKGEGLYTSQQCKLLNEFGFDKVIMVSADLSLVDFSWNRLSKDKLINRIRKLSNYYGRTGDPYKEPVKDMFEWLNNDEYDNRLIVDNDYAKYIKRSLNKGHPVIASINWHSTFKHHKGNFREDGDIKGIPDEHAIIIRGYDQKGVFVVDSHYKYYVGKLSRFKNGYYKISWEKFLVNTTGALILI